MLPLKNLLRIRLDRALLLAAILVLSILPASAQRFVRSAASIAELLAQNPADVNTNIFVAGYYGPGTGGGGEFTYSSTDSTTVDGGLYLKPTAKNGRWIRQLNGQPIDVKMFGAKGDGSTDDTTAIQAALDAVLRGGELVFPDGTYVATSISLANVREIRIRGPGKVFQAASASNSLFTTGTDTNLAIIRFQDITLDGNNLNRQAHNGDSVDNGSLIATRNSAKALFCNGVTFTNSLRAAIRCAGDTWVDEKCVAASGNEHDGTNATYIVYAEPTENGHRLAFRGFHMVARNLDPANLYKNPGGIFVTEKQGATNIVYRGVLVDGCTSDGIGQKSGAPSLNVLDPVRCGYNGAAFIRIVNCYFKNFSYGGVGIQRSDFGEVLNCQFENGTNTTDGDGYGVAIAGQAREGSSPFTGGRSGEQHFNYTIANNHFKNVNRVAISTTTPYTDIRGNIIEGVWPSASDLVAGISVTSGYCNVSDNWVKKVSRYHLILSSADYSKAINNHLYSDGTIVSNLMLLAENSVGLTIKDNDIITSTASDAIGIYASGLTNSELVGNLGNNFTNFVVVRDSSKNLRVSHTRGTNTQFFVVVATNSTAYLHDNNDSFPFISQFDTNGDFTIPMVNIWAGGTLAKVRHYYHAPGTGLYVGAFQTNHPDSFRAGRGVFELDNTTAGMAFDFDAVGQDVRYNFNAGSGLTEFYRVSANGPRLSQELPNMLVFTDANRDLRSGVIGTNDLWSFGRTGTGYLIRTGLGTITNRQIIGDTEIVVTFPDGVASDTTLSIGSAITRDTEWDTSAKIAGNVSDELGTGPLLFGTNTAQEKIWVRAGITNLGVFGSATFWPGTATTLSTTNGTGNTNVDIVISAATQTNFTTFAMSDMTTDLTTGATKQYWRAPYACTIIEVRSSLVDASSSGLVTVDINKNGSSILSTKLSIDQTEKTSLTAATPAVISDTALADDDEVTFDIDAAGADAKGLQVKIYYTRP